MCSINELKTFLKTLLTKILLTLLTILYVYDFGGDFYFVVVLFENCHTNYGISSLCIIGLSTMSSIGWCGQAKTAYTTYDGYIPEERNQRREYRKNLWCGPCLLIKSSVIEIWKGEDALTEQEHRASHRTKFIESIFESFLQLGLSFYIIHHHGLDEPKFTNFPGDVQIGSIIGSVLSVIVNFLTRHAYLKMRKKPSLYEIFIDSAKWNLIPITCSLIAYFIILADNVQVFCIFAAICLSRPLFMLLS